MRYSGASSLILRPRPAGRASRVILLAGAIALLAACGGAPSAALRAPRRAAQPSLPVAGPRSPEHFAKGATFWPVSEVAVLSDDRTLVAVTTWGCDEPPRLDATELAGAVVLVLVRPPPTRRPCAAGLTAGPVHTRLGSPLGGRKLLRRTSLTAIPVVYQSRLAAISVLPPGYRFDGLVPGSGFSRQVRGDRDYSTRTFSARDDAPLTVSEATGTTIPSVPAGWAVTATTKIGGQRAACRAETFDGAVDARSVAWSAGGRVFIVTSQQDLDTDHVPSQAQLLAVARGVH
jgi:hypothetical protein